MTEAALDLDPQRQARAREYARVRRRLFALQLGFGVIYLAVWLATGWHVTLRASIEFNLLATGPWWLLLLFTAAGFSIPWSLITFPLGYYAGFVLPHRYELSTQTIGGWILDRVKGFAVSAALGIPLLLVLYALIRGAPETWWLWTAAVYTLFGAVLTALAPVLLMPIFYKLVPLGEEHQSLIERLLRLAEQAGTHVRGVYTFDMSRRTKAANAALVGMGRTRRILLGDTLLTEFSEDEIETVLAHELGHHVHKDIPFFMATQTAFNFVAFFLAFLSLNALAAPLGLRSSADPAGLPLLGLLFGAFGLITMPLTNAISRWRERMADAYALAATRKPEAFAQAMTRLANQNLADANPERWVVLLLHSHPPLRERIARAERWSPGEA